MSEMLTALEDDVAVVTVQQRPVMALVNDQTLIGVERLEDLAYVIWRVSDLRSAPFEVFMAELAISIDRKRGFQVETEDVRDFVLDLATCQWLRILSCEEVGIAPEWAMRVS